MNRILSRYGRDAIVAIYRDGCGLTADLPDLVPGLLPPSQWDILGAARIYRPVVPPPAGGRTSPI